MQNQVLSVLDKEASQVMAALSHVIEKVKYSSTIRFNRYSKVIFCSEVLYFQGTAIHAH